MKRFSLLFAATIALAPLWSTPGHAKPPAKKPAPMPQHVSLATIKKLQAARARNPKTREVLPILQPLMDGKSLKGRNMKDLATDPPIVVVRAKLEDAEAGGEADAGAIETTTIETTTTETAATETGATVTGATETRVTQSDLAVSELSDATVAKNGFDGKRFAQAFPPAVRPAPIRRQPARVVTPRWVRYPLEFQLAGIGLGTKAVNKDRFNRIDRYGLFAIHGNPTAVVVPTAVAGVVISNMQQPPEVSRLFPNDPGGHLPDWASAIIVSLDRNHVQWLYRRETYSMGFVVDRLGFVDAIVVAGIYSPITKTQLEDPVHTVKLGDDLRKVLFRYGYPDTIETYKIGERATGEETADVTIVAEDAVSGLFKADKTPEGAEPDASQNTAFRTFEVRYEQSYNIVFTIRNNRVVRIYIFGDPDFFNEQRRNALRTGY